MRLTRRAFALASLSLPVIYTRDAHVLQASESTSPDVTPLGDVQRRFQEMLGYLPAGRPAADFSISYVDFERHVTRYPNLADEDALMVAPISEISTFLVAGILDDTISRRWFPGR